MSAVATIIGQSIYITVVPSAPTVAQIDMGVDQTLSGVGQARQV